MVPQGHKKWNDKSKCDSMHKIKKSKYKYKKKKYYTIF